MKTLLKMFVSAMCMFAFIGVQAQAVSLCNEKFSSKTPQGWSIQPTSTASVPTWTPDKSLCVSTNYSMHGYVPFNSGDTAELVTPYFDCSQYKYVMIQFSHICKVLPSDVCQVMYQEQGLGTYYQWKPLPSDAYKGKSTTYSKSLVFSHSSYSEWKANDTFATPSTDWFKEESFDVSDYASFTKIRFKFIIRKGSYYGSFIANGWYIDDFKVTVSNTLIKNPVVEFQSAFNDTVYSTGPFTIKAKVASRSRTPIKQPYLVYTTTFQKQTTQKSLKMTAVEGDSIWTATIPQQNYGTIIRYSIDASDSVGNTARAAAGFVLKRKPGLLITGYTYYQPGDTVSGYTNMYNVYPTNTTNAAASRCLYFASEIGASNTALSIGTLAWYNRNYNVSVTRNLKIWMLPTTATQIASTTADPAKAGATLVYDGTTNSTLYWNEVTLDAPFVLPKGQNLVIYFQSSGGTSGGYIYWASHYQYYRNLYSLNGGLSYSTGYYNPLMRFGLGIALDYDSNSVAMESIQPQVGTTAGTQPVKVTIRNTGLTDLTTATIGWSVNGVFQGTKTYKGKVNCDFVDTLTLGTYTQRANTYDTIVAWVNMPNNIYDSITIDDTLSSIVYGCTQAMSGNYVIGNNGNFATIQEALTILNACGMKGDVTFQLASGTHTEAWKMNNLGDNFGPYHLTITSQAHHADSVILTANNEDVLTLNNSKQITFNYLTINSTKRDIVLKGNCSDLEWNHCKILGGTTTESQNNANVYSSDAKLYNIRFVNNDIQNASYSFYMIGSASEYIKELVIDSNNIISGGSQATMLQYCDKLTFSHNNLTSYLSEKNYAWRNAFSFCYRTNIDGNYINVANSEDYWFDETYAIELEACDSITVSNNEIILIGTGDLAFGIYTVKIGSNNTIINNSIFIDHYEGDQNGIIYEGIHATTPTILRNNIAVTTGEYGYPLYIYDNANNLSKLDINYNCWYNGNQIANIYANNKWNQAKNLSELTALLPAATHDIIYNPTFVNHDSSLRLQSYLQMDCPRVGSLSWDKDGKLRSGLTSRGCYSDNPPQFNAGLLSIVGWSETTHAGDTLQPYIVFQNGGLDTITKATIAFNLNKVAGTPISWIGKLATAESDTLPMGNFIVKGGYNTLTAYITSANGKQDTVTVDDTVSVKTYTCDQYFAGNYNIGDTCSFTSLSDAVNAIERCGMNGPVTLRMMPGTYPSDLTIGSLPGMSDTNTLTITSYTGKNDVVLARTDLGFMETAPLNIVDGQHIILSNLTFDATHAKASSYTAAHGLALSGNTRHIEVKNCAVKMPKPDGQAYSDATKFSAFYLNGRTVNNINLHDNTIDGGAAGFFVQGSSSTSRIRNISICNNVISNVDFSGVYVNYADSITIHANRVSQRSGNFITASMDVIYANYTNANITNNHLVCTTINRGIYLNNFGDTTNGCCNVINNEIIGKISANDGCGMYIGTSTSAHIYHNSIYVGSNQRIASGVWFSANLGSIAVDFRNNIVCMSGIEYNNYPIYRANASNSDLVIGYNAFYNAYPSTPILAYINDLITDWADYRKVIPQDTTSKVVLPEFMNPANNLRVSDTIGISCPVLTAVAYDINDSARTANTAMGAYNFYRANLDLAVKTIINPSEQSSITTPETVKVVIANKGLTTITTATLNYRLNGTVGTAYQWKGNLATSATDTITLANIQAISGTNTLSVFISNVNGKNDDAQGNDTLTKYTYGCNGPLKGSYTVGGAKADFASINDAMNTMSICGMGGNITFKIANGTYSTLMFENITYTDLEHTLTFTSASGNRDSVIFTGNYGLYLKNCNYLNFDKVTFMGSTNGVQLENTVTYVSIKHCNIIAPSNVTSAEYRGINYDNYASSGYSVKVLDFVGNNITGGYYNVYFKHAHQSAGNSSLTLRVSVDSNVMSGAYRYGFYSYQSNDLQSFNNNIITNGSHAEEFDGIYMEYNTFCDSIFGNIIHINTPKRACGIFGATIQNNPNQMGGIRRVSNNEIVVKGGEEKYGIKYLSYGGRATLVNNSIYVSGTTTSYAMALGSSYDMKAYNNLLIGGSSVSIPFYAQASSTLYSRDYNNYYTTGNTLASIGGTQINNLSGMQSTTGSFDQHSSVVVPSWKDTTLGSLRVNNSWKLTCPIYDEVNYDVLGMPRTYVTAKGCYDVEADTTDAGLVAFAGEKLLTSTGTHKLSVILKNDGQTAISAATVALYVNGTKMVDAPYAPKTPLAYRQTDSVLLGYFSFPAGKCDIKAIVSMQGDNNTVNDTITTERQICSNMVGGTYVIGNSAKADYTFANYTDLFDLVDSCGINNDVVLAFESGTYLLTADITVNTDFMQGYHLTWTSLAKNRDSVIFQSNLAASTTQGMFMLGGANNVTFCDLTMTSTNRSIFQVNGPNKNVEIRHCNLFNGRTATYGGTMTITNGDNPSAYYKQQNWRVIGNHFEGGCRSFKFRGSASEPLLNWTIDSNLFEYGYDRIIQLENADTLFFRYNQSYSRSTTTANHFHLYTSALANATIIGNYMDATTSTTSKRGDIIVFYSLNAASNGMSLVANNVIKTNNTTGNCIRASGCKANITHNSFYMTGNSTATIGLLAYGVSSVFNITGNVFYGTGGQISLQMNAECIGSKHPVDYNNYYNAGNGTLVNWGGTALKSLNAIKLTTLQDTHSVSVPLNFLDPSVDLRLTNYAPVLMPNMGYIGYDYYGNPRSNPTAMGAYEPSFQKLDASLTDFATTKLTNGQSSPVAVTLSNVGTDTLKTADIDWTVDGTKQNQVKWTGTLPVGASAVVNLGNIVPAAGKSINIVAWVSNPNNGTDSKLSNDTISMSEYICKGTLAGNYIIGDSAADFQTLNDAVASMKLCGISAPVVLQLRSGSYEAVSISENIPGASRTNTITVMPVTGNTVAINGGSTSASLTLTNAAHWKFENITIGNDSNGLIGVLLQQNLENITFRGCNIYSNAKATSTANRCVSYPNTSGSGKYPVDVRFIQNNIRGGYYNFYLYYTAASSGNMATASIYIDSNNLSDAYYYGIYTYYYSAIKSLCYNTITNRSNSGNFYGVYSMYYAYWDKIEGNRIHLTSTGTTYGFYLYYYQQYASYTASRKAYLVNNEINIQSNSGTKYGIYNYYPYGNWEMHHNSVYIKSTGTKYGMYLYNSSTAYKMNVTRNFVACDSVGTTIGTCYPLYISSTTYANSNYGKREYNNWYSPNNVAYIGGARANIAAMQSVTSQDSFSLKVQPDFIDSTLNLRLNDYSAFACRKTNDAQKDIDGKFRGNATSIGCYGAKMHEGINMEVCEFVSPKAITDVICYADYTPIAISFKNSGMKDAQYDSSALKVSFDVTGAITYHFDTTITTGVLRSSWTDTLMLGSIPTMVSGAYNIRVILSDTADHINGDDTLNMVYNAYRVELPYDVDFSTQPAEFVNNIKSGTSGWSVVQGTGKNPSIAPTFGTGRLEFAGAGEPGAFANAIFNAVNIRGCINPKLSFWYAHTESDKRDMMTVLVTSDGGATYHEVGRVIAADTADYWKRYDIDLSPYANTQCLSIVFQAISFGGVNQNIDRVLINADKDVQVNMLPIDLSNRVSCDNTPVEVKAVLTNNSPTNIQLVNDTVTLNVSGAITKTNTYVYNNTLSGNASDTITLGQLDMTTNGNYYLEIYMQSQDDNASNDTLRDSTILVDQNIALTAIRGIDAQTYKLAGDSVNVSAVIVNTGNLAIDHYTVQMDINGNTVLTDTVTGNLGVGDSVVYAMSKPFIVPTASKDQPYYVIGLTASIACDVDEDDNTVEIISNVTIPDTVDIQVLDIAATSPVMGKTKQAPTVRVANIGNTTIYSMNIYVAVLDSTGKTVDNISGIINELQANDTTDYLFTMNYKVPNYTGNYTLKAYVEKQQADSLQSNDTLCKQFSCTLDSTAIGETEVANWNMGQNIPNPASSLTRIPFTLPSSGEVVFTVMSANGQLIYREQISAEAGNNSVSFDASNIAGGIYYYSMEYQGQRLVKKMNVLR